MAPGGFLQQAHRSWQPLATSSPLQQLNRRFFLAQKQPARDADLLYYDFGSCTRLKKLEPRLTIDLSIFLDPDPSTFMIHRPGTGAGFFFMMVMGNV